MNDLLTFAALQNSAHHSIQRATDDVLPRGVALLRLSQFRKAIGMADTTVYRAVKAGRFPKPFITNPTLRLWKAEDIREWMRVGPDAWLAAHPVAAESGAA
ncbi:AlpA family phage regulatory protein [Paraburkholderia sp. UYCP14C]|uniref:helix-turn-helix transcriptional regulator n=1 Tax=Paraburkholderia sp. UYCP14C TaxID=2511130 RepID=UPI0010212445|nr:AlpA family phage regulatory protein [Paraburkholderia sp. UYCP14C]RZF31338.1 AlpA family phage regulatory protein [Paraburkholderia sp. UYCP14C]